MDGKSQYFHESAQWKEQKQRSQVIEQGIPNRKNIIITSSVVQHWTWLPKKVVESVTRNTQNSCAQGLELFWLRG